MLKIIYVGLGYTLNLKSGDVWIRGDHNSGSSFASTFFLSYVWVLFFMSQRVIVRDVKRANLLGSGLALSGCRLFETG